MFSLNGFSLYSEIHINPNDSKSNHSGQNDRDFEAEPLLTEIVIDSTYQAVDADEDKLKEGLEAKTNLVYPEIERFLPYINSPSEPVTVPNDEAKQKVEEEKKEELETITDSAHPPLLAENDIEHYLQYLNDQRKLWPTIDRIKKHIKFTEWTFLSAKTGLILSYGSIICKISLRGAGAIGDLALEVAIVSSLSVFIIPPILNKIAQNYFSTVTDTRDGGVRTDDLYKCLKNRLIIKTRIESERTWLQFFKNLYFPKYVYDFDGSITSAGDYRLYQRNENCLRERLRDKSTLIYDLSDLVKFFDEFECAQTILNILKKKEELDKYNNFLKKMNVNLVFEDQTNDPDSSTPPAFKNFRARISNVVYVTNPYFRHQEIVSSTNILPSVLLEIVSEYAVNPLSNNKLICLIRGSP